MSFPAIAFESRAPRALAELASEPQWYAAYTCPRHEKQVARQLEEKSVEAFLPVYHSVRRWKDRRKAVEFPLFPGYIFVRLALRERLRVLDVPSVVRLVGFNGQPAALPEEEIQCLRACAGHDQMLQPHAYLQAGRRVRVTRGPLEGLEGILLRQKGACRFVISLHLIQRSVAAEVDASELEPCGRRGPSFHSSESAVSTSL